MLRAQVSFIQPSEEIHVLRSPSGSSSHFKLNSIDCLAFFEAYPLAHAHMLCEPYYSVVGTEFRTEVTLLKCERGFTSDG